MNAIKYINKVFFILLSLAFVAGCDDDNTSDLQLNGQTWLNALQLDEYQGVIDNSTKTVVVGVPVDYNTDAMKVTAIEVSDAAEASMKVGDIANFSFPQTIKVTNGDAYLDYTVTVKHDEARITSLSLNKLTRLTSNYQWDDISTTTITITPATGSDRATIYWYIAAGAIGLIILTAGIIIIKKKILK